MSALQSGVTIEDGEIFGTLKYVTDYTGFSGDPAQQEGNYIALKIDTEDEDDVITVELTNGSVGHPVELDSDRNIVIRITNPMKQKIIVEATHVNEDESVVKKTLKYDLHHLVLEPKEDE